MVKQYKQRALLKLINAKWACLKQTQNTNTPYLYLGTLASLQLNQSKWFLYETLFFIKV